MAAPPKSSLERLNDDNASPCASSAVREQTFHNLCLLIDDTTFECARRAYRREVKLRQVIDMDVTKFVTLSTSVCNDLRTWVEEARRYAVLTEGQLLTLSDAADVIDRATTTLTATRPDAASYMDTELTDGERSLSERVCRRR